MCFRELYARIEKGESVESIKEDFITYDSAMPIDVPIHECLKSWRERV